jgi:hypothetical protein
VLLQRSQIGEKIWVTPARLTGLARRSNTTQVRLTKLAKTTTQINKQIGLAGLAKTVARIDEQIGLTKLAGLATRSRKQEVPVGLLTRKARL